MPSFVTFLPIVGRELRVASRRHTTYAVRLAVATIAMVLGLFLYAATVRLPRPVMARYIFTGLSIVGLLYCLAAGRRFTADCISEEKREGTLGLLFLTHLRGYDVVLGKLAATSLDGFFGLLAMFPVMAVPLLLGGVTNGELWRMVLVLINTFLFSLAVGIFASALSWEARRAMGANFLWLLLLGGLLPAIAGTIGFFSSSHIAIHQLLYPCPAYAFYLTSDANYRAYTSHFWSSLAVIHASAWILVALASRLTPRLWQDAPSTRGRLRWRERWQAFVYGGAQRRVALRRRLLHVNAFYWLASRAWFKPAGVWLALVFLGGWWLFMQVVLQIKWSDEILCFTLGIMLNILLKLWIAVETSQRLAEEQKIGAMELLLSTPLTVRDILHGQYLSLRRQFLGPLILVVAVELFLICFSSGPSADSNAQIRAFGIGSLILLAADLPALVVVAMTTALTAKSPNHASVSTIIRVLALPWIIGAAIAVLTNVWLATMGSDILGWRVYLALWLGLGLIADMAFALPAARKLRTQFRELALRRALSRKAQDQ